MFKTNHERNQWIKVSKSRVRRLIRLNEPINVKSMLSDDKYVELDLSPWTAKISIGDLSNGELDVTISPTAITAVLFNLEKEYSTNSEYEEGGETMEGPTESKEVLFKSKEDRRSKWAERCSTLLTRYWVYDENEHPMSSRNYMTGDYITLTECIRSHLGEAERLIETLSSGQVAPIRDVDKSKRLVKPDKLTDMEIMNHYVLLPHEGQLRGRTNAHGRPIV